LPPLFAFILIGCPLVSAGILLFLYSIVSEELPAGERTIQKPRPRAECPKPQLTRALVPSHPFSKQTSRLLTGKPPLIMVSLQALNID
jgi:hypothetical protein